MQMPLDSPERATRRCAPHSLHQKRIAHLHTDIVLEALDRLFSRPKSRPKCDRWRCNTLRLVQHTDLSGRQRLQMAMTHMTAGSLMPTRPLPQWFSRPCHPQPPTHVSLCAFSFVAPAQHGLGRRCRDTTAGQQISPARRNSSQVGRSSTLDMATTSSPEAPAKRLTKQDLVEYLGSGCSPPDQWR